MAGLVAYPMVGNLGMLAFLCCVACGEAVRFAPETLSASLAGLALVLARQRYLLDQ